MIRGLQQQIHGGMPKTMNLPQTAHCGTATSANVLAVGILSNCHSQRSRMDNTVSTGFDRLRLQSQSCHRHNGLRQLEEQTAPYQEPRKIQME